MSWFSNLFTNEAVTRAVMDQQGNGPRVIEPYDSVRRMIYDGSVQSQISVLLNLVLKLPTSPKNKSAAMRRARERGLYTHKHGIESYWPHREKLAQLLRTLSSVLTDVDVNRADLKTLLRVIDLCNDTLPSTLREMEIKLAKNDWDTEANFIVSMEIRIATMLDEISLLPTTRSILNVVVSESENQVKAFPEINTYSSTGGLYEALTSLQTDWNKAVGLPLSAEDDYVIERVGNSYLPDALLLFDRFRHRTGSENNQKAMKMVVEQVELIHQQVLFVIEQHEEDSFDLMETHTEFLKMKNSRMGASLESKGLSLDKLSKASESDTGSLLDSSS